MKKTITALVLAATVLLVAPATAFATHVDDTKDHGFEQSQDEAGFGTEDCRPGPQDHSLVGSWTPYTEDEYVDEIIERSYDPRLDSGEWTQAEYDARILALEGRARATWIFCDKNRDGTLCVLTTEPSPYYYTLLDNRPFRG
jgi:hypothetical protein